MEQNDPLAYYHSANTSTEKALASRKKRKSVLGLLRFGAIALIIVIGYVLWSLGPVYLILSTALLLAIFTRLVIRDLANSASIRHLQYLLEVIQDEISALEGKISQFGDGKQFLSQLHDYANDLDIFGRSSIFQFANRTGSEPGQELLANWLLASAPSDEIRKRQDAVKELAQKPDWRLNFLALTKETSIRNNTRENLAAWAAEPPQFRQFKPWAWLRILLPAIMLTITGLAIFGIISINVFYLAALISAIFSYQVNKIVAPVHAHLSRMADEMDTLQQCIKHIESENFTSDLLVAQQAFIEQDGQTASTHIRSIKKILERFDLRYNILISFPLNVLLMWNLQQVLDLEKWKSKHQPDLLNWFSALAHFEALSSFGNMLFNHPAWCFAQIREDAFVLEGKDIGHPLIPDGKRVDNPVQMNDRQSLMLVTGSNMAGKSTYLRSIGVNMVLAMAGAPCCATSFTLTTSRLMSSMRVADNLEESTSTFYAELKKLKSIIDAVNNGEKVFILLDEILRGTNSGDRHTGSEALIRQLLRHNAPAILATHDLGLASLAAAFPGRLENFHFDVQVSNEELYFDYKLKEGVCQSLNASILMKKIGIEL